MVSVLLRFRDVDEQIDTIASHDAVLQNRGHVYWGWWRKKIIDPEDNTEFFSRLQEVARREPIIIGMFDRSKSRYFFAEMADLAFGKGGGAIPTPEFESTPEYYVSELLPAWFKLRWIKEVKANAFVERFNEIPSGDLTIHPIGQKTPPDRVDLIDRDYVKLTSATIVHISDVHLGEDHGDFTDAAGSRSLPGIIRKDLDDLAIDKVGLLVQSGDLTSKANITVLQSAGRDLMHKLCGVLDLHTHEVVMIPGNHDYALDIHSQRGYDHAVGYNLFVKEFYGRTQAVPYLHKFMLPTGRRLEILTIDSIKLRKQGTSNYGWVDWNDYEGILKRSKLPSDGPPPIRIAIIHHHLVPAPLTEAAPSDGYDYASVSVTLNAGEVLQGLQQHGFKVVLHGHQHSPAVNVVARGRKKPGQIDLVGLNEQLYVLAGGSAGAKATRLDKGFPMNTYGLLTIEKDRIIHLVRKYTSTGFCEDHYRTVIPL